MTNELINEIIFEDGIYDDLEWDFTEMCQAELRRLMRAAYEAGKAGK